MLRSPEIRRILRFPNFTMVGHHYVLPIAKDNRGEVQGSVLRTSASNETVYVEPTAISEQSAQLSFLRAREAKEVRRILRWLSAQVGMVADALVSTLDTMAELDLVHAQGRLSIDYRMSAPQFNDEGRLVLRGARHPLLEALFRDDPALVRAARRPAPTASQPRPSDGRPIARAIADAPGEPTRRPPVRSPATLAGTEPRTVTPIDVNLGLRFRILVVTGPNTGGKTVASRRSACWRSWPRPACTCRPVRVRSFRSLIDVLTDIGDEQSLEQSLSTFSSHVGRIREILGKATSRSLVLLDELGAGTDPTDGAALGRAILDELDRIGCRAIVTTHIGDLEDLRSIQPQRRERRRRI